MRRTVSLAAMAGMLLALGGLAEATPVDGPAPSMPTVAPTEPAATATATVSEAGLTSRSAATSGTASTRTSAPERVGVVAQVDRVLGYDDAPRSMTLRYPGASYVKVHLSRLLLLPGDYLTVSDPTGTEVHRYAAGPLGGVGELLTGGQWAMSVTGDAARVRLHSAWPDPAGLRGQLSRLGVTVDKVARGLTAAEAARGGEAAPAGEPARVPESVCGRDDSQDAVCYRESRPAVYQRTKAVVRLLINGVELCTGFRIGAGNRLLTNNHCLQRTSEARSTEVWFNYQCSSCGGWAVFRPTKVWADEVLATDDVLDFTVFTVADFASVQRYGHLELETGGLSGGERLYVPQHPMGMPTRVATASDRDRGGACRVADPAAPGYAPGTDVTYYCDTQGGSSGSPVLSATTHRVVALHHLGGCPNSGVRADLIHQRIADLL